MKERALACLGEAAIKRRAKEGDGRPQEEQGSSGVKGHRNETALASPDRLRQAGTKEKKSLWKVVLEPESQTRGAQLPKILCLIICGMLI